MENRKGRLFLVMLFATAMTLITTGAFAGIDQGSVDKCKTCHEEVVNKFMAGAHHGKVWSKSKGATTGSCESCHGNGDKHMEDNLKTSIITFGKHSSQSAEDQNKQCLNCHQKSPGLAMWKLGAHKRNDVSCASCHSGHGDKPQPAGPETCFKCHTTMKGQMQKLSHHPVVEGKVSCNDCHNVHGTTSHGQIKGDNLNQLCYKCHQDKRGPFMWEHAPVEENCSTCHKPHGSNHAALLVKPTPLLCKDCHEGPHGQVRAAGKFVGRACLNCHSKIHGSNGPAGKDFTR